MFQLDVSKGFNLRLKEFERSLKSKIIKMLMSASLAHVQYVIMYPVFYN